MKEQTKEYDAFKLECEADKAIKTMERVAGANPMRRTAQRPYPMLRYMVAYHLHEMEWPERYISSVLGKSYETIFKGLKQVKLMLEHPKWYPTEHAIWIDFQAELKKIGQRTPEDLIDSAADIYTAGMENREQARKIFIDAATWARQEF